MKGKVVLSLALVVILATASPAGAAYPIPTCAQVQAYVDAAVAFITAYPSLPDVLKAQLIQAIRTAAAKIPCKA